MNTNDMTFYSEEFSLRVTVNKESINNIYQFCNEAYHNETGGILVGRYADKVTAEIVVIIGPNKDSRKEKTNFIRGTKGINKLLEEYWKQELYYLGEWHFHPNGISNPSSIDMQTMKTITNNSKYNCPEPILIIVSGLYNNYQQKSYLFSKDDYNLQLKEW